MKRVKDEEASGDGTVTKKRVRFDPDTKDNSNDAEPSVPTVTRPVRRQKPGVDDDLDLLGRKIQPKSEEQQAADDELKDKKHTLDSDEEDDTVVTKKLDIKTIHGQENATIEYDESIKIMPFNMTEEMEEGYYDEEGNYVFEKKKEEIHDEWLDTLDWDSVKQKAGTHWNKMTDEDEDDDNKGPPKIDGIAACELILKHLTDEKLTVNDVLKRMNSQKNLTPAEERKRRWEAKKKGVEYKNETSETANELTGAVDDLISLGHMEAYSMKKQAIFDLYEQMEIAKERAERAERMKRLAEEEEAKRLAEAEAAKADTTEGLINDLLSDEDEGAEEKMETEPVAADATLDFKSEPTKTEEPLNDVDGIVSEPA